MTLDQHLGLQKTSLLQARIHAQHAR